MGVRKLLLLEPTAATQQLREAIQSDDWEICTTHTTTEAASRVSRSVSRAVRSRRSRAAVLRYCACRTREEVAPLVKIGTVICSE